MTIDPSSPQGTVRDPGAGLPTARDASHAASSEWLAAKFALPRDVAELVKRLRNKRSWVVVTEHGERNQYFPGDKPDKDAVAAADTIERFSRALAEAESWNEDFAETLAEHWLTGIHCDHETKTDTATCACSLWRGAAMQNIPAAVADWIEHVSQETIIKRGERHAARTKEEK